jgi:cation-transporting ATPase I
LAARVAELGKRGLRVLAVAERSLSEDLGVLAPQKLSGLEFRGFLVFTDPLRPSAAHALGGLARAGVRTVLLTGDHPSTAQAIAAELAPLNQGRIVSGAELADLEDPELDAIIGDVAIFARVTPAQKVRIVRSLQRLGSVVAMAGDGANDAPAIRLADVGVAIGEHSTAAARSAADIILSDGRIETLVNAVAEGRAMWASVRDAVSILLGGNFGEIAFTAAVGLVSGRPPLNARQLLLVNLLTDIAPAMAIALRPPTQAALEELSLAGPEATLGKPLTREIAVRASLTALGASSAWAMARLTGGRERARTVALAALVGTQLAQTLRSGHGSRGVLSTGVGSAALLAAIIQTPGLSQFFGCRPLGPIAWATAIGASAAAASVPLLSQRLAQVVGEATAVEHAQKPEDPALTAPHRTDLLQ